MDEVGCSLGVGMMPPKKKKKISGTVAVSTAQGQKSCRWILQNPLPSFLTTSHGYQAATRRIFLALHSRLRALKLRANGEVCWAKHLPCSIKLLLRLRFEIRR